MQKLSWVRPLAACVLVIGVAACGGGGRSSAGSGPVARAGGYTAAQAPAKAPVQAVGGAAPDVSASAPGPVPVVEGSRVIRSGQVGIEVKAGRFDSTYSALIALAGEEGGLVAASNASTDSDRIKSGTVTLSVPSAHFQETIDRLRQMGAVHTLNVTSQDVSQQYVDLQARRANAEAERDAMLALLQRAQSVQEILAVQNQLGQYTQQVEQLKGQIAYLDHATGYSSIQVSIREAGIVAPRPPQDEWGLGSSFWTGLHALVGTVDGLLVVLVVAGPYALLAGAGWLLWRRRRRPLGRPL